MKQAWDVKSFELDLKKFTDEYVPERVLKLTRAMTLDLLRLVVMATPVGNPSRWFSVIMGGKPPVGYVGGRARAGWQVTLNMPSSKISTKKDQGGAATISTGTFKVAMAKAFQPIWITNNVPYILVLEQGRHFDMKGHMRGSIAAPAGMLAISINAMRIKYR